jgi:hypothetical protein
LPGATTSTTARFRDLHHDARRAVADVLGSGQVPFEHALANVYVRRWAAIIFTIGVLWLFRDHLKDLASLLWPTIVGLAVFNFRSELNALLRRTRRIGREGAEFEVGSIAAQIMTQPVEEAMREVAPGESNAPYILARVVAVRNDLNVQAGTDQQRRENLLTLRFAQTQQARDFQVIWLNIFASQLEALGRMALEQDAVDLQEYFDAHVERVKALPARRSDYIRRMVGISRANESGYGGSISGHCHAARA